MAKISSSKYEKALNYKLQYKGEFAIGIYNDLFCNLCCTPVDCSRKSSVDSHRNSKKHVEQLKILNKRIKQGEDGIGEQTFLDNSEKSVARTIILAFLSADIPLNKLKHKEILKMFKVLGAPSISATTSRLQLEVLYKEYFAEMIQRFRNKNIYMVVDESEINKVKYVNIMGAIIEEPSKIYLLDCIPLVSSVNAKIISDLIVETLKIMEIQKENVRLIISDAARYMIKSIRDIKDLIPDVFHVQCLAHLIHNCAMRIKGNYKEVDFLISSMKAITHKNKTIAGLFETFGKPPGVIVTRWSSWLRAVIEYYCVHFPQVKRLVQQIPDNGILIKNAKESVDSATIFASLCEIKQNYEVLIEVLDKFEDSIYTIQTGYDALYNLDLKIDPLNLKEYLSNRLEENEISRIVRMKNEDVSPEIYCKLLECPPTSISVERSFSMLSKLQAKDRNFKQENIRKYMFFYYNNRILLGEDYDEEND